MNFNRNEWSRKLDDTLLAYHTTYKIIIGISSYQLVYAKSCHLPVDVEQKAMLGNQED